MLTGHVLGWYSVEHETYNKRVRTEKNSTPEPKRLSSRNDGANLRGGYICTTLLAIGYPLAIHKAHTYRPEAVITATATRKVGLLNKVPEPECCYRQ
jgi:hypothetical protein